MGKNKYIRSPKIFLDLFNEFKEAKLSSKIAIEVPSKIGPMVLNHTPPLTWAGFDAWLFEKNIIIDTGDYRTNENGRYNNYSEVIRAITNIMYAQKFEGAAVGAFKENLIARDLGLADKKELKSDVVPLIIDWGPDLIPTKEETKKNDRSKKDKTHAKTNRSKKDRK